MAMSAKVDHARQLQLVRYPDGMVAEQDVTIANVVLPPLGDGEMLVAARYISVDPAIRVYMDPNGLLGQNKALFDVVGVHTGQRLHSWIVGEVIESRSAAFPVGSVVRELNGQAGVQDYCVLSEQDVALVDPALAPLSAYLGALGMPGFTAYAGLIDVGRPAPGETVVVSAAAGGVGGIVGQIAKAQGCHVIGIAGGADKCAYARDELGYDACIDYKSEHVGSALDRFCPAGINVYFDNVGGKIVDQCIARLADHGRVIVCGAMSDYQGSTTPIYNYFNILSRRARIEGFNYYDVIVDRDRFNRVDQQLRRLVKSGSLKPQSRIFDGLDNFVPALRAIYQGRTCGKTMLKI